VTADVASESRPPIVRGGPVVAIDGPAGSGKSTVAARVADFVQAHGRKPGLEVVLVGDDEASRVYVRNKVLASGETGVASSLFEYPASVSEAELLHRVAALNADAGVHGILVQLPLPRHVNAGKVLEAVSPAKDVDGFHEANLGALLAGAPRLVAVLGESSHNPSVDQPARVHEDREQHCPDGQTPVGESGRCARSSALARRRLEHVGQSACCRVRRR
jgi:ABC-type dipeptide/oligopeptide/nickel transport system ATPase component